VRPVALVILSMCALYPGLSMLFQGVYPFWSGEFFLLMGDRGPWMMLAGKLSLPVWLPSLLKIVLGLAWLGGVPGLWAGDWRAYPVVVLAAVGSLLYPTGPAVMGAIALICLVAFREDRKAIPV